MTTSLLEKVFIIS